MEHDANDPLFITDDPFRSSQRRIDTRDTEAVGLVARDAHIRINPLAQLSPRERDISDGAGFLPLGRLAINEGVKAHRIMGEINRPKENNGTHQTENAEGQERIAVRLFRLGLQQLGMRLLDAVIAGVSLLGLGIFIGLGAHLSVHPLWAFRPRHYGCVRWGNRSCLLNFASRPPANAPDSWGPLRTLPRDQICRAL